MASGERIKLETNTRYLVELKYVDFRVSEKYGDEQIKVTGTWDQIGLAHTYLPHPAVAAFKACGAVTDNGTDKDGHPEYKVVRGKGAVVICRREDGKKKTTEVALQGQEGAAPAPAAKAPDAAATSASPPARPRSPAGSLPVEAEPKRARLAWALLAEGISAASKIAARSLVDALHCELRDIDQQALASLTATVLIRAETYNVPVALHMGRENGNGKGKGKAPAPAAPAPAAPAPAAPAPAAPAPKAEQHERELAAAGPSGWPEEEEGDHPNLDLEDDGLPF